MLKQTIDDSYARLMIANDGLGADVLDGLSQVADLGKLTGHSPNQTLAQVALISQFEQMMYERTPSTLKRKSPLPDLNMPVLPAYLSHLTKELFATAKDSIIQTVRLLELIFKRGYVVPPTVWLPSKATKTQFDGTQGDSFEGKLPRPYLAWCDWASGADVPDTGETLTAETWDDFYPAKRLQLLKDLRASDPDVARLLIEKFAPAQSADKRLDLVGALSLNLSADDVPFLQSLNKDRSAKVKELACELLARLGHYDGETALVHELFDELEWGADGIVFKVTKNNVQRENRKKYLQTVNLYALAQKFELSIAEFLLAWDFEGNEARGGYFGYNDILYSRAVGMIGDDELNEIAEPLIKATYKLRAYYYFLIRHRLSLNLRQAFAQKQFLRGEKFHTLLGITPDVLEVSFGALKASSGYKKLINATEHWQSKHTGFIDSHALVGEFTALGLLVSQEVAKDCLEDLQRLGIAKTDPALSMLHFNALLDKKSP